MARTTRTSLPEDDYLLLIGQVAYMVGSLEWTVLGDLPGLAPYLPADLNTPVLAGQTTGAIGIALTTAVDKISDDAVRAYVELAGRLLCEASVLRNDVLHARPATVDGNQRLYRWKAADRRGPHRAVIIDTALLENVIDTLSAASSALGNIRPTHKRSPPA